MHMSARARKKYIHVPALMRIANFRINTDVCASVASLKKQQGSRSLEKSHKPDIGLDSTVLTLGGKRKCALPNTACN